jgi:uncharacterized protein YecE (DUF72 family)
MLEATTKIGCCGFTVAQTKYFQNLQLVEIQQTFYQPPKYDTVKRWRDKAPCNFEFTLKAWQLITHEASSPTYRRLKTQLSDEQKKQVGSFRWIDPVQRAWETTLRITRLLDADKVVFQCPASFSPTDENKDRLRKFFSKIERSNITCIWEPRGAWQSDEIAGLCRELSLIHCVDPFKAECVTRGLRYYRLHGITGYRHQYSDKELRYIIRFIAKDAQTYFLFNNASMWQDAIRLKQMLITKPD